MVQEHHLSERRACRLVGLSRDAYRNPPKASAENQMLSEQIKAIALERRRFGYRRVHDVLRSDFPGVNHKRVYRLYKAVLTQRFLLRSGCFGEGLGRGLHA